MEKISSYQYPTTRVGASLELIRAFRDKLKGVATNKDALASALGYKSANNGAFTHKLMDLRRYGLIEGRGSEIKLSELAKKLLAPHSKKEEIDATKEMVLNVPLYREIYDKFGTTLPTDFGAALQNITHADRLEVDEIKERISKLYIDAVSKLSNEVSNEIGDNMNIPQTQEPQRNLSNSDPNIITLNVGKTHLEVPKSDTNIELLITALKSLKGEEEGKKTSSKSAKTEEKKT